MIRIIERDILTKGLKRTVPLLERDGEEGILQKSLAEFIGIQDAQLSLLIVRHQLHRSSLKKEETAFLRQAGVMSLRAPKGNFVPKSTMLALIKITESHQAKSFFSQVWPGESKA